MRRAKREPRSYTQTQPASLLLIHFNLLLFFVPLLVSRETTLAARLNENGDVHVAVH